MPRQMVSERPIYGQGKIGGGCGGGGGVSRIGGGRSISSDDPQLTDSSILVFFEKA